ncbi:MAG: acyl-CoA dehydrogenase family protein [Atopobiaceae bacterium]
MDFTLNREQELARSMFRQFAEEKVAPLAKEVDAEERFPEENVRLMASLGMLGIFVPRKWGGAGADELTYAMAVEELSKKCATTGVILSGHSSLGTAPILDAGTDEQRERYLPKLASGEWLAAFALTEPGAGTDAQGLETRAEKTEGGWVLNGTKIFITNAGYAHVFIIFAVTGTREDARGRKKKEISAFIVERTDPGFSVGKPEDKMGIRGSSTCELIMQDCFVPEGRMLGAQGRGFALAMKTLDGGRIGIAAQALGIAQGAIDETVAYVKERVQFGRSLAAFQNTQFELAEMQARTDAARYLVYRAALAKQAVMDGRAKSCSVESAEAKLIAARTAMDVTTRCLQLFGGYGYTRDYPIERMMRDAKITEIYEGTSEVQMMVISSALLR